MQASIQGIDAEVFVVDNMSVDGSVAMVRAKFPDVQLIANQNNVGFSVANNQAIKLAKGEYVLLLNPDTVVEEDTLSKCCNFLDNHPEAGGLGVKMVDGKGRFLPESKRGLPTPGVAFSKISGLSRLFPQSRLFGKYHLGFLEEDKTHEVEILSGAFMMLRKSVLDKIGLLDEAFFMYGEDIDMSWRIVQAGYKNYYLPEARIIHYKGESTKKSSVNYVFVFYRAMIIFARKHFSEKHAKSFAFVIHLAIYMRAAIAIVNRFVKRTIVPAGDIASLIVGLFVIKSYYTNITGIEYSDGLLLLALPVYSLLWVLSIFFSGGYDKPVKLFSILKGIFLGTALILILYSLLPESYRFSRALILLGAGWTLISYTLSRWLLHLFKVKGHRLRGSTQRRFIVVAGPEESLRISSLLMQNIGPSIYIGSVSPQPDSKSADNILGNANQIAEIVQVHRVTEIIFSARDVSAQQTIDLMVRAGRKDIEYTIAPPESMYLIGSNSIQSSSDLYVQHINSIDRPKNKRSKRLLDVLSSMVFIAFLPVIIWFVKQRFSFISNIIRVLMGWKTWVGYAKTQTDSNTQLPPIKPGVINPAHIIDSANESSETRNKMNLIYAKDYKVIIDLMAIGNNFKYLGNRA